MRTLCTRTQFWMLALCLAALVAAGETTVELVVSFVDVQGNQRTPHRVRLPLPVRRTSTVSRRTTVPWSKRGIDIPPLRQRC